MSTKIAPATNKLLWQRLISESLLMRNETDHTAVMAFVKDGDVGACVLTRTDRWRMVQLGLKLSWRGRSKNRLSIHFFARFEPRLAKDPNEKSPSTGQTRWDYRAFTGLSSDDLTEVVHSAGPRIVHRPAFANALWRSTATTGLAIPNSASATGTFRILWSANFARSSIAASWRGGSFVSIAVHAVWIA